MEESLFLHLQAECSLFFEENPHAIENEQGLAIRLGRNKEDLAPVLEKLMSLTIIRKVGEGDRAYYRYNQPNIMERVAIWENK